MNPPNSGNNGVLKPMCPICGDDNAHGFIYDPRELRNYGFSPIQDPDSGFSDNDTAELGICPAASCITQHGGHPYGVPLIPREKWETTVDGKENTTTRVDYEGEACRVRGCLGTYRLDAGNPVCDECGDEIELMFGAQTGTGRGDAYYVLRKKYADALIGREEIVNPPYYVTSSENPRRRSQNAQEGGLPEEVDRMVSAKHPDDWFNCLETYLWTLVNAKGYRHEHLTAAAYLDKTFRRGHVEPLWLYASERNGVGNNIERAFVVASDNITIFEGSIKPSMHVLEPSRDSIQVVYRMIKSSFGNLWPFFANEAEGFDEAAVDAGLIEEAIVAWRTLETCPFYQKFFELPMLRAPYDLNGLMTSAPGLVESICILWSTKRKNQSNYQEIRNKVFPDGPSFWRRMLTDEGIVLVERLEMVFKEMSKRLAL